MSGLRDQSSARAVHARGEERAPLCGESSLRTGRIREVTCRQCLILLQEPLARDLCYTVQKLNELPKTASVRIDLTFVDSEDPSKPYDPTDPKHRPGPKLEVPDEI